MINRKNPLIIFDMFHLHRQQQGVDFLFTNLTAYTEGIF